MDRIQLTASSSAGERSIAVELDPESPWSRAGLLDAEQPTPLPVAGPIDRLEAWGAADRGPDGPESLTVRGCPAAALLPLLWCRGGLG